MAIEQATYNGWANYATWRVNLEFCDDIVSSLIGEQTFATADELAEHLRDECEEWAESLIGNESTGAAILTGWVSAFLSDVDWREIAEANEDELVRREWDGVEDCHVCGRFHDPADCGLCDRCGDYHPAANGCGEQIEPEGNAR